MDQQDHLEDHLNLERPKMQTNAKILQTSFALANL